MDVDSVVRSRASRMPVDGCRKDDLFGVSGLGDGVLQKQMQVGRVLMNPGPFLLNIPLTVSQQQLRPRSCLE